MNETQATTIYRLLHTQSEHAPESIAVVPRGHRPCTYRQLLNHAEHGMGSVHAVEELATAIILIEAKKNGIGGATDILAEFETISDEEAQALTVKDTL